MEKEPHGTIVAAVFANKSETTLIRLVQQCQIIDLN